MGLLYRLMYEYNGAQLACDRMISFTGIWYIE